METKQIKYFASIWFTLVAFGLGSFEAQELPPLESGLTEQVRVELVQFNILALDKGGRPVTDLKPEELELKDDGREQKIAFLERFASHSAVTETQLFNTGQAISRPQGSPTEKISQRPEDQLKTRWFMLVFDNFGTSLRTRTKAVDAARQFLESDVKDQDRVAIVSFTGKLEVLQPFTSDRTQLLNACIAAGSRTQRTVEDREGMLDDLVQQITTCRSKTDPAICANRFLEAFRAENLRQVDVYLTGLTTLIRSLAPIPETKALVLISDGFPRDPNQEGLDVVQSLFSFRKTQSMMTPGNINVSDRSFDRLGQAAAEARVTIFPIYPGGSLRSSSTDARRAGPLDETINNLQIDIFSRSEKNMMMGLADIARRTGGELIRSAEPVEGLRRVNEAAEGIYTLGFYPRGGNSNARLHDLKVKSKRKGVEIKFAKDLLQSALRPALPGMLTVSSAACEGDRRRAVLKLEIPRRSLTFERVKTGYAANFSLYLAVQLDGNPEPGFFDYRVFNLSVGEDDSTPEAAPQNPKVEQTLVVPCRGLTLKAIVSDLASGAKGTFSEYLPEAK